MEGFTAEQARQLAHSTLDAKIGKKREREHAILGEIKDAAAEGYFGWQTSKYKKEELDFLVNKGYRVVKGDDDEKSFIAVEWD